MSSTCDASALQAAVEIGRATRPVPDRPSTLRRIGTWLVDFARELDRGYATMYGRRSPDQPTPAELDTLARTGVIDPSRR